MNDGCGWGGHKNSSCKDIVVIKLVTIGCGHENVGHK